MNADDTLVFNDNFERKLFVIGINEQNPDEAWRLALEGAAVSHGDKSIIHFDYDYGPDEVFLIKGKVSPLLAVRLVQLEHGSYIPLVVRYRWIRWIPRDGVMMAVDAQPKSGASLVTIVSDEDASEHFKSGGHVCEKKTCRVPSQYRVAWERFQRSVYAHD